MTKAELIAALEPYPADAEVVTTTFVEREGGISWWLAAELDSVLSAEAGRVVLLAEKTGWGPVSIEDDEPMRAPEGGA